MIELGITDHLEGPRDAQSAEVYADVIAQTELADSLGFNYAWFAEHHAHAHFGHLPTPILFALHMAGRTRQIRPGSAVVCLNLHHPLDVAEHIASADWLMQGRSAFGLGSGSTPEESVLFGSSVSDESDRHRRFEKALRLMRAAWAGAVSEDEGRPFAVAAHHSFPLARADLPGRIWVAVNSVGAAKIAGAFGFSMLFSHLRTPTQYREYDRAYRAAGGAGRVAANRPVHVARDDATAWRRVEPALRILWRRFQTEGKIAADVPEPDNPADLCQHPINFIVGGPQTVATALASLRQEAPFDVANVEVRWAGLARDEVEDSLRHLAEARRLLPQ